MSRFKRDIKKIVLAVLGCVLLFNAGYDVTRFVRQNSAKKAAAAKTVEFFEGGEATAVWCQDVRDVGMWVCDLEVTLPDGRQARLLQAFSYDDLAE